MRHVYIISTPSGAWGAFLHDFCKERGLEFPSDPVTFIDETPNTIPNDMNEEIRMMRDNWNWYPWPEEVNAKPQPIFIPRTSQRQRRKAARRAGKF